MEHPLVVPSQHNALMIAAEWEMQQPYIKPDTMPIVR
jgi:chaperone required for assembly of F1-ATPase